MAAACISSPAKAGSRRAGDIPGRILPTQDPGAQVHTTHASAGAWWWWWWWRGRVCGLKADAARRYRLTGLICTAASLHPEGPLPVPSLAGAGAVAATRPPLPLPQRDHALSSGRAAPAEGPSCWRGCRGRCAHAERRPIAARGSRRQSRTRTCPCARWPARMCPRVPPPQCTSR